MAEFMRTITVKVSKSVIDDITKYKEETGIQKNRIVENALKEYLKKNLKKGA